MSQSTVLRAVGFIGLGTMGHSMARNLMKAGFAVRVFDVRREAIDELAPLGAQAATSIADAARGADAVVAMLPNTPNVEAVVMGEDVLLANPPSGRLIVDMSTIAAVAERRMNAACAVQGIEYVDAPVSGGPIGAKNATLTIMAGGSSVGTAITLQTVCQN
jgi:2-hydroxy-3-oxopropionate reductase